MIIDLFIASPFVVTTFVTNRFVRGMIYILSLLVLETYSVLPFGVLGSTLGISLLAINYLTAHLDTTSPVSLIFILFIGIILFTVLTTIFHTITAINSDTTLFARGLVFFTRILLATAIIAFSFTLLQYSFVFIKNGILEEKKF